MPSLQLDEKFWMSMFYMRMKEKNIENILYNSVFQSCTWSGTVLGFPLPTNEQGRHKGKMAASSTRDMAKDELSCEGELQRQRGGRLAWDIQKNTFLAQYTLQQLNHKSLARSMM